jgi:hypothetical protein
MVSSGGNSLQFQAQGGLGRTAMAEALGVKPGEQP